MYDGWIIFSLLVAACCPWGFDLTDSVGFIGISHHLAQVNISDQCIRSKYPDKSEDKGGKLSFKKRNYRTLSKNQLLKAYKQGILEVNVECDLLISTKLFELRL